MDAMARTLTKWVWVDFQVAIRNLGTANCVPIVRDILKVVKPGV